MKFIKEHIGFILTFFVTYGIGLMLTIVQYVAIDENIIITINNTQLEVVNDSKNFMKILLDFFVPTTITYSLGCVLINLSELLKEKADEYIFNLCTCLFIVIYVMIFSIYMMTGFSVLWIIIELLISVILLALNVMCYFEKYKHKNNSLT